MFVNAKQVVDYIISQNEGVKNIEILNSRLRDYISCLVTGLSYEQWAEEPLINLIDYAVQDDMRVEILRLTASAAAVILRDALSLLSSRFKKENSH